MPSQKGWLTPNEGATETVCRPLLIPLDDELFFLGAVNGALNELTKTYNWEAFGSMSPEDAAATMLAMYEVYISETCCDAGICLLPPDETYGIDFYTRVLRLGSGGFTEELMGGVWQAPTGDYEVPAVTARSESTAVERRCAAAFNAANVLEQVYEDATDAASELGTYAAIVDAILDAVTVLIGAFAGPTAAGHVASGQAAFNLFADAFQIITGDVWNNDFTDELACIFFENTTDTAGVVTFDYMQIQNTLLEHQLRVIGDLDRQILFAQVEYLLSLVAAGGLDISGTTTAIVDPDCGECGDFCDFLDFSTSSHSFSNPSGPNGFYDTSLTPDRWRAAQNWTGLPNRIGLRTTRSFSARFITEIAIDHDFDKIIGVTADFHEIRLLLGGNVVWGNPQTVSICGSKSRTTDTFFPLVEADTILFGLDCHTNGQADGCSGANGTYNMYSITIKGMGSSPFGVGNCP